MNAVAYLLAAFATAVGAAWLDPDEDAWLIGFYGLLWWITVPVCLLGCVARVVVLAFRRRR